MLAVVTAACGILEPPDRVARQAADLLRVTFEPAASALLADGGTLTMTVAFVGRRGTSVALETSLGKFTGGSDSKITVKADSARAEDDSVFARARLELGRKPGTLSLTVTVEDLVLRLAPIKVGASLPDSLELTTSRVSIVTDGSANADLVAHLFRAKDAVSENVVVHFEAFQDRGNGQERVGRFIDLLQQRSDAKGQAKNTFTADAIGPDSVVVNVPIVVRASVFADFELTQAVARDSVVLIAKPPDS